MGKVTWKGLASDTDKRYKSGSAVLTGRNLKPASATQSQTPSTGSAESIKKSTRSSGAKTMKPTLQERMALLTEEEKAKLLDDLM